MRRRGSVLLVVLVVLLALGLVAGMSLRMGGQERRAATVERDRTAALALSEEGLARTEGWLGRMLENGAIDLDRGLDPNGDTTCVAAAPVLTLGGGQADDHLPPFTDGAPVVAGPAGLSWMQVAGQGGSFLVRVDDNADDRDPLLPAAATSNTAGCVEGSGATLGQNPVRDRDRSVVVTAVGVFPGTDTTRARSTRVVTATFAPPPPTGIYVNGDVDLHGAAHVCGAWGSVRTTGSVLDSCLCGTACPGHSPCATNEVCDAQAAGPACNTSASGGGGTCLANQPVPPGPRVSPWDARNAPPACAGPNCTPFFYLRLNGGEAQVHQWNYAATPLGGVGTCNEPAAWPRLCHPGDTVGTCAGAGCWALVYSASASGGDPDDVRLTDAAAFTAVPPVAVAPSGANPRVFETKAGDDADPNAGGCGTAPAPPYPWATGGDLAWDRAPSTTFEVLADGAAGERLPRGVWFIEGNVKWKKDAQTCAAHPGDYALTLLVLGDVIFEEDAFFRPASRRGVALVVGRDMEVRTGNTDVESCTAGAFMVREQAALGGNTTLEGQLIVDNRGSCSNELTGPAGLELHGTAVLKVSSQPPIAGGPALQRRSWAESSW